MKDFLNVFRFLLKQSLSPRLVLNQIKYDKTQRIMYIVILIVLLFSLPSYGYFIKMFSDMFDILNSLNQAPLFIFFGIMASVFIILIFGLYQIIAYFFFSNEVKILMTYPIKTNHILLSKFFVIYMIQLVISVLIVLPFFIIFGIKMGIGIINWVYLILSFLLLPIIPLVVIGIITILIMRLTKAFKNKDAIRMVSLFLILVLALGFQVVINRFMFSVPEGEEQQYIQSLLDNNMFLINKVSDYYPIVIFVIDAITESFFQATLGVILLAVTSAFAIYLFTIVLKHFFLKTYLVEQESTTSKSKRVKRNNRVSSVALSIAKIDFITLLKVPIYAFNCLLTVFLFPILILIFPLIQGASGINISEVYNQYGDQIWLLIALGVTAFSCLNQIAPTSFSREGKTNWIMRTLPISAKDHLLGRFLTAYIAQIIFSILMFAILIFTLQQGYVYALLAFIFSNIAAIPLLFLGIYIDLKRPMLKWDNPQVAVKQNLNVLLAIAMGFIYGLLSVLVYLGLNKGLKLIIQQDTMILHIIIGVFFIINLLLMVVTYRFVLKDFEKSLVNMG